jgi:hypothetical protein
VNVRLIRPVRPGGLDTWLNLRRRLFLATPRADLAQEQEDILSGSGRNAVLIA